MELLFATVVPKRREFFRDAVKDESNLPSTLTRLLSLTRLQAFLLSSHACKPYKHLFTRFPSTLAGLAHKLMLPCCCPYCRCHRLNTVISATCNVSSIAANPFSVSENIPVRPRTMATRCQCQHCGQELVFWAELKVASVGTPLQQPELPVPPVYPLIAPNQHDQLPGERAQPNQPVTAPVVPVEAARPRERSRSRPRSDWRPDHKWQSEWRDGAKNKQAAWKHKTGWNYLA